MKYFFQTVNEKGEVLSSRGVSWTDDISSKMLEALLQKASDLNQKEFLQKLAKGDFDKKIRLSLFNSDARELILREKDKLKMFEIIE